MSTACYLQGRRKRFIDDVELYGHNSGSDVFWFEKNDKRCFFPISQVKYFGASCNYVDKLRIYVRSAKLSEHHSFGESLMKGCL